MGRPREFDEDEALHRAMLLFWRRGYPDTSVRDLCEAMELRAGSFYASFESKEALFARVLQRYLRSLQLPSPGPGALAVYFERVIAAREPRGCLLALSALESEALPEPAHRIVRQGLAGLDQWLTACLGGAEREGRVLATAAMGLQVRHRAGQTESELRPIVESLIEAFGSTASRIRGN